MIIIQGDLIDSLNRSVSAETPQVMFELINDLQTSHDGLSSLEKMSNKMVNDYSCLAGQTAAQHTVLQRDRWLIKVPDHLPPDHVNMMRCTELTQPSISDCPLLDPTLIQQASDKVGEHELQARNRATFISAAKSLTHKEQAFAGIKDMNLGSNQKDKSQTKGFQGPDRSFSPPNRKYSRRGGNQQGDDLQNLTKMVLQQINKQNQNQQSSKPPHSNYQQQQRSSFPNRGDSGSYQSNQSNQQNKSDNFKQRNYGKFRGGGKGRGSGNRKDQNR